MRHAYKRKIKNITRKLILLLGIGVIVGVTAYFVWFLTPWYRFAKTHDLSYRFLANLLFSQNLAVKMYKDRTNIVMLGVSGGTREGALLTDTMLFISIDTKNQRIVLVSIPRDIWVPTLKHKINASYETGEKKKPGGGMILAKSEVSEVLGQPIHYAFVLDFTGFKDIVDLVGGVEVAVEHPFDDYNYPIPGKENDACSGDPQFACRFEHIRFEAGTQHMDGETALKYVRSRQAIGEEGNDFARGKRQQAVILALREKLSALSWKDYQTVQKFIEILKKRTATDMKLSESILLAKFILQKKDIKTDRLVLDTGEDADPKTGKKGRLGLLVNPPLWEYGGAWVLVPRTGNYDEIHEFVNCHLEDSACSIVPK